MDFNIFGFDSPFSYPSLAPGFQPLSQYNQVDKALLQRILEKQSSTGSWTVAGFCSAVAAISSSTLAAPVANNPQLDPIWATVVALAFITRIFPSQQSWWDIYRQKAMAFLNSTQTPPDLAANMQQQANLLLESEYNRLCRDWDRYRVTGNKSSQDQFLQLCSRLQKIQEITPDLWIGLDHQTGQNYSISRTKNGFGYFYSAEALEASTVAALMSPPQQQPQPQPQQQPPQMQQQPQPQPQQQYAPQRFGGAMF